MSDSRRSLKRSKVSHRDAQPSVASRLSDRYSVGLGRRALLRGVVGGVITHLALPRLELFSSMALAQDAQANDPFFALILFGRMG